MQKKNLADQKYMEYATFRQILMLLKFGDISPSKTPLFGDPIFTNYPWNFFLFPSGTIRFRRKTDTIYFRAQFISIDFGREGSDYFRTITRILWLWCPNILKQFTAGPESWNQRWKFQLPSMAREAFLSL